MHETFRTIIESMGGRVMGEVATDGAQAIKKPGEIIHEVGGARMGDNPATSVLNQYCQSWQVPNLFVTDGAGFVSNADKNPTLSIMANAWRSADYLVLARVTVQPIKHNAGMNRYTSSKTLAANARRSTNHLARQHVYDHCYR